MVKIIIALLMASVFTTTTYTDIGDQRITSYCPSCNDGAGYECTAQKRLEYGDCACSWLPNGTKLSIEGARFTVNDTCGTEAIDIFIDTDECYCNLNEYRRVVIIHENVRCSIWDLVYDNACRMASKRLD